MSLMAVLRGSIRRIRNCASVFVLPGTTTGDLPRASRVSSATSAGSIIPGASAPLSALRDCPEWRLTLLGLAVLRARGKDQGGKKAERYFKAALRGAKDQGLPARCSETGRNDTSGS